MRGQNAVRYRAMSQKNVDKLQKLEKARDSPIEPPKRTSPTDNLIPLSLIWDSDFQNCKVIKFVVSC